MLISKEYPLILGSASPRRRDLLSALGIPILVQPRDIDETALPGEAPEVYLERIVEAKMSAVLSGSGASASLHATAQNRAPEGPALGSVLLVADTIVVLDQEILGKPRDQLHALSLLRRLSGKTHRVMTRFALADAVSPISGRCARTVKTEVTLAQASEESLERYAATGEGLDKAGAYAAQGIGAFLVKSLVGSYTNVVGLPVSEVVEDLVQGGWLKGFP